jgi:hypothetical protein
MTEDQKKRVAALNAACLLATTPAEALQIAADFVTFIEGKPGRKKAPSPDAEVRHIHIPATITRKMRG